MTKSVAIGIDLGATNIKVALVDERGRVVRRAVRECTPTRGPDRVIADMAEACRCLLTDGGLSIDCVVGAGLGSPGPINLRKGMIIRSANLPGWQNVPIRDRLRSDLGLHVELDNDANAAAYGEYWAGSGYKESGGGGDLVLLTLGTGVGAGVVLGGQLLHGHFGNAAELGHLIVVADGLLCPCGQRGCLEQYASASAVARRTVEALSGGAGGGLAERVRLGSEITSMDVARAAAEGDELCGRIWREACLYLAIACVNIQHAYNPARIVLGGGLSEAGDALLSPVRDAFRRQTWSLMDDAPAIVLASLGYDAGVIGAAGLAWKAANQQ